MAQNKGAEASGVAEQDNARFKSPDPIRSANRFSVLNKLAENDLDESSRCGEGNDQTRQHGMSITLQINLMIPLSGVCPPSLICNWDSTKDEGLDQNMHHHSQIFYCI